MSNNGTATQLQRIIPWRRVIFWTLALLFAWVVWSRIADIDQLLKTLREGQPLWIGVALGLQLLYYVLFSGVYWSAFHARSLRPF